MPGQTVGPDSDGGWRFDCHGGCGTRGRRWPSEAFALTRAGQHQREHDEGVLMPPARDVLAGNPDPDPGDPTPTELRTSVSQEPPGWAIYDSTITAHFDGAYPCGQFVTGEWFVVAPDGVDVTPDPVWSDTHGRHGAQINPASLAGGSQGPVQGYMAHGELYLEELNVARQLPIRVMPGDSLVMTHGVVYPGGGTGAVRDHPQYVQRWFADQISRIWDAMVLTVLDAPPPVGSFRPPFSDVEKRIWTVDDIRWDRLPNLSREGISGIPSWEDALYDLRGPGVDHVGSYLWHEVVSPYHCYPRYGRQYEEYVGGAILKLLLDYPQHEKEPLLYRAIQRGIDNWGQLLSAHQQGRNQPTQTNPSTWFWSAGGQHSEGRKTPIVFAAAMLGEEGSSGTIAQTLRDSYPTQFHEDSSTGWNTCDDGSPPWPGAGYAYWDERANGTPRCAPAGHPPGTGTQGSYYYMNYRMQPGAGNRANGTFICAALTAHSDVDVFDIWSHDPYHVYSDWHVEVDAVSGIGGSVFPFLQSMWDKYRDDFPRIPPLTTGDTP